MRRRIYDGICTLASLLLIWFTIASCTGKEETSYYLVTGGSLNSVEKSTVDDLIGDLNQVLDKPIQVITDNEKIPEDGKLIIVGTTESNKLLDSIIQEHRFQGKLRPNGGIRTKVKSSNSKDMVLLVGFDTEGLQQTIYDYSKEVLRIDPLAYWTGKEPQKSMGNNIFDFENKSIAPPKVPIRCYFENDVDELANYRGKLLEYDWESYTEMIDALVRLRYNAIQFFDMLGRPEFFLRPEYQKLAPDYQLDVDYLDKMMDYAHAKGMKIQVDFALSYQLKPLDEDKASCWKEYKEDWMDSWRYYFEETPLAKTDIFILRPRNQVWDWEYKSSCGEDKIEVFNEVFQVFDQMVDSYKKDATKALICYSDAMDMYNQGFRPPKDWIIAWSDDGFGGFEHLPETTDGYQFGTYMHAGFWLNHTVHNPYPERVEEKMKIMFDDYGADAYCMVNGQTFRPFLLNIEAYSQICQDPTNFDAEQFYTTWSQRYFNKEKAEYAVKAMKALHQAQNVGRIGYVQHLWEIREAIAYLSNSPIQRPGKAEVPYTYERVANDFDHVQTTKKHLEKAFLEAKKGMEDDLGDDEFYYSYIYLPIVLYRDLINFETTLHKMASLKRQFEIGHNKNALESAITEMEKLSAELQMLYDNRLENSENDKWKGWYDPKIRRPNNGFPTSEMLFQISENLRKMSQIQS